MKCHTGSETIADPGAYTTCTARSLTCIGLGGRGGGEGEGWVMRGEGGRERDGGEKEGGRVHG